MTENKNKTQNNDGLVEGYITPSDAEIKARKNRNLAIAACLLGFVTIVFFLMLSKSGFFEA